MSALAGAGATCAAIATGCSRRSGNASLKKAAQYLWSQQAEDGGFHSSTYGLLRSGQSLTPFALNTLLEVPDNVATAPAGAIDRALAFIRRNTRADGTLGLMDETSADYPNFATALAVLAITRARRAGYEQDIEPMITQLR